MTYILIFSICMFASAAHAAWKAYEKPEDEEGEQRGGIRAAARRFVFWLGW